MQVKSSKLLNQKSYKQNNSPISSNIILLNTTE